MIVEARPAATLILVRERHGRPEILLLKRNAKARFMPNAYVFAGGAVDVTDASPSVYASCSPMTDAQASRRLSIPSNGLQYFVAAIREAFEECGLLLAYDTGGRLVDLEEMEERELRTLRAALSSGELDLASLCRSRGWRLAADAAAYFSHWITPVGQSRRFDTRFFIGRAPPRQRASVLGEEMSELVWRTAAEALSDHDAGRLLLMRPTYTVLGEIAPFGDMDALFAFAWSEREILPTKIVLRDAAAGSAD